ncbi:MAG: hypothetical protein ABH951_01590 [Patescibacteria group bacterium]
MNNKPQKISKGKFWFAGYIVAGLTFYLARSFSETIYDEIIIIIIAILCGYFYHKLKKEIKLKNEWGKIIITFLILEMIAAFSIGLLTNFI